MTLTKKIWDWLKEDSQLRLKVALALKCTEQNLIKRIKVQSDVLTKKAALVAISEHTGLTEDEIIETVAA